VHRTYILWRHIYHITLNQILSVSSCRYINNFNNVNCFSVASYYLHNVQRINTSSKLGSRSLHFFLRSSWLLFSFYVVCFVLRCFFLFDLNSRVCFSRTFRLLYQIYSHKIYLLCQVFGYPNVNNGVWNFNLSICLCTYFFLSLRNKVFNIKFIIYSIPGTHVKFVGTLYLII